jgi:hypothetical protein
MRDAVMSAQGIAGRSVSIDEHKGKGTVYNIADNRRAAGRPITNTCSITGNVTAELSGIMLDCGSCVQFADAMGGTVYGSLTGDINGSYTLTPIGSNPLTDPCPGWHVTGPTLTLSTFSDEGTCVLPVCSDSPTAEIYFRCCSAAEGGPLWEIFVIVPSGCLQSPGILVFDGDSDNLVSGGPFPHPGVANNYLNCGLTEPGRLGTATMSGWT